MALKAIERANAPNKIRQELHASGSCLLLIFNLGIRCLFLIFCFKGLALTELKLN